MANDSELFINEEDSYFITAESRGTRKKSVQASFQKLEYTCQTDEPVNVAQSNSFSIQISMFTIYLTLTIPILITIQHYWYDTMGSERQ